MARKSLGKKIRFEVFKRDSFTCQYCGRKSPDIVLNVDHITPVSKGGKNNIENLISSCFDCNSGKSDRALSDDHMVEKSRSQLEISQERAEQVKMVSKWASSMSEELNNEWDAINSFFVNYCGYEFTNKMKPGILRLSKKFGFKTVIEAIPKALEYKDADDISVSTINNACKILLTPPGVGKSKYCRGIYANRFYLKEADYDLIESSAMALFEEESVEAGIEAFKTLSEKNLMSLLGIKNV